ncbi:VOC family protein [Antarcticibacterium sp. 1MA-6-2]|uniref:VOC family protein n=1 Tax=Antarcticibacterium sp. 1MA-6-2 TaxID=2908210 RepID=UPI001F434265|nr:VOC family protein [Antarcticibacterium sp. 1MA-6-2]UJH91180.1 VOC family protein [Antarcticibacterium sp. 1MA-6-2]
MKIERLELQSKHLTEQLKFYRDVLELEIPVYDETSFEVKVGYTSIKFTEDNNATPYHIAFHIPDKQEEIALTWTKGKVPILRNNSDEIIDFSNWSAKSFYFYDADKNIVEFIARRNLFKPESSLFSEENIIGVAEIGLATENIEEKFLFLQKNCELEVYDGNFEKFSAIGDDEGLLITINKELKDWFPTEDKAFASPFKIKFSHRGKQYYLKFENDKLTTYSA